MLWSHARELGWPREQIAVIEEDLGLSGSGFAARKGSPGWLPRSFSATSASSSALGPHGSLATNADWYRLLDLCGHTDTLIGDADGTTTRVSSMTACCLV
jgi:hypothetical protein